MKGKLEQVIKDLGDSGEAINNKYSHGVVHGFSEKHSPEFDILMNKVGLTHPSLDQIETPKLILKSNV